MKNGGGHFAPELGGHFELESGGHFKLELGGQYHWNLQYKNPFLFIFCQFDYNSYNYCKHCNDYKYSKTHSCFKNPCYCFARSEEKGKEN